MSSSQPTLFVNFKKNTLYTTLFIAFVDYMGVGLVYPLFAAMLFDQALALLPQEMSQDLRGLYLGILIALMPLAQFFSSPLWGAISDGMGRKKPLLISIGVALVGYLCALWGVTASNIWLLCISRVIIGCAAGNMSIVQAALADLSSKEEKATHFGLYSMALGVGFTLGPFFGGILSNFGYSLPFLFAFLLMGANLIGVYFLFKETHSAISPPQFKWNKGFSSLRKALYFKGIRTVLFCSFLHNFGWSYFFEFTPVYLISQLQFTPPMLGFFYAAAGCFYALSTGLFIRPFVKRLATEKLFFWGNLMAAFAILMMPFVSLASLIWPLLFLICFFVAFVTPSSTTLISQTASSDGQGEALGILSAVNAAALIISPLFSGSFVGKYPYISMQVGGGVLLITAGIFFVRYCFKLGQKEI
ncbi:MFS transporter [Parachlamydia sp. AcF125]|uniref:MFS transporter n=1 Tax=Parachlamydia sp. AcF125 TaxID=2795736 RepID=UPI001BC99AA5|nr:MFS transporter [Parachlamydia sp. AcF125]MBS4168963.1 Tetracycline resistance protein, class C [Parachlamydia sp. AcF125]